MTSNQLNWKKYNWSNITEMADWPKSSVPNVHLCTLLKVSSRPTLKSRHFGFSWLATVCSVQQHGESTLSKIHTKTWNETAHWNDSIFCCCSATC